MLKRWVGYFIFAAVLAAAFCTALITVYPVKYMEIIRRNAGRLNPAFVCAVIHTESKFRPEARSAKGAVGLMQLTEATAEWMAETMDMPDFSADTLSNPDTNIAIGCYFLNWLMDRYENDVRLTLCAYNAGLGNVEKWLSDTKYSADGKTLDHIPFPETHEYVKRVATNEKIYGALLSLIKV